MIHVKCKKCGWRIPLKLTDKENDRYLSFRNEYRQLWKPELRRELNGLTTKLQSLSKKKNKSKEDKKQISEIKKRIKTIEKELQLTDEQNARLNFLRAEINYIKNSTIVGRGEVNICCDRCGKSLIKQKRLVLVPTTLEEKHI